MKITQKLKAHFEKSTKEQLKEVEEMVIQIRATIAKAREISGVTTTDAGGKVNSSSGAVRMEILTENEHLALALRELQYIENITESASEQEIKDSIKVASCIGAFVEDQKPDQNSIRNKYQAILVAKNFILNNVGVVDESSEL